MISILPVPVIDLLFRSKFPPSCGVISSIILEIPPPPPEPDVATVEIPVILPFESTVMIGVLVEAP